MNRNEEEKGLSFLISLVAIAVAEVEATKSLTYYRRKGSDESAEQFRDFCEEQQHKLERFREDACCPLMTSVIVFFTYVSEMKLKDLGFFAATKKWCYENSINHKALMDIKTCLFRMGDFDLNCYYYEIMPFNGLISKIFSETTIPLFQSGYKNQEMEFIERKKDKWFVQEDGDEYGSFYRLNNRGFSKDFPIETNCILALALSEVQSVSKVIRFVGPFVPLKPVELD